MSEEILERFSNGESVWFISKNTKCSWNRVVKILSSNGIIINDTHLQILNLKNNGMSAEDISNQMGLNIKTVKSYLPTVRGCIYKENRSKNAETILRSRKKSCKQ